MKNLQIDFNVKYIQIHFLPGLVYFVEDNMLEIYQKIISNLFSPKTSIYHD